MNKALLIKNGHIVDPSQGLDEVGDILIEQGKIAQISTQQSAISDQNPPLTKGGAGGVIPEEAQVIDAAGLIVMPGLVDMHTHLREPGFEHKETIRTGTMAAIRGGVTSVCCMPNTDPVHDNPNVTAFIVKRAAEEGSCSVFPIGAITKGQKGEELAEMGLMQEAGCIAFSDDGRPVMSSLVMRRALEYSKALGVPIISHCEDISLAGSGVMHEGDLSTILGLRGIPAAAEEVMVARDILLSELTGGRLHLAHVSTEGSVRLIRQAKERGVKVTAETCPHYFTITEDAVRGYNTAAKVNPPLRTMRDLNAIREGLRDGTIDVIVTDHAPHHRDEKLQEFDKAPPGISGLETSLSLSLRLVEDGVLTLSGLVEKMALVPSQILGLGKGTIRPGADADLVILDPAKEKRVDAAAFLSKGKNTPFDGWLLKGGPVCTVVAGRVCENILF